MKGSGMWLGEQMRNARPFERIYRSAQAVDAITPLRVAVHPQFEGARYVDSAQCRASAAPTYAATREPFSAA